ncbi:MAG: sigma-54-dependent Fis family transcriptional regulator [Fusobacteria bacterium]|nr:sigma-54-dependent Fis family transcriptional regulator [Fusobacteriota bacterium]
MEKKAILAISEQSEFLKNLRKILKVDYEIITFDNYLDGLDMLRENKFEVMLLDENIQWFNFTEAMRKLQGLDDNLLVIALINEETDEILNEIKSSGIYDHVLKPVDKKVLDKVLKHAINNSNILREKKELEKKLMVNEESKELIGQSPAMKSMKQLIEKIAESDLTVLVTGETGVGKELVVREIYKKSLRKKKPFITINCSAMSPKLIESELFGHEKGAFTGADTMKKGIIEEADGGTLFLDEIGDMDIKNQAKLLRAIEYGDVRRVGGNKSIKVNVRFVAATNKNLKEEVERGEFRRDLYHRLTSFPIQVPPLRDRKEDIPLLANSFLNNIVSELHKDMYVISSEAMKYLLRYDYPGNIRELKNIIERMAIISTTKTLGVEDLPLELKMSADTIENKVVTGLGPLKDILENEIYDLFEVEKVVIAIALQKTRWNKQETAKLLGIGRTTLYEKIKKYNLDRRIILKNKED